MSKSSSEKNDEDNRNSAISKLVACHSLAARLVEEGSGLEVNQEEAQVLQGFKEVWLEGWLEGSSHIHQQAGLSRSEVDLLRKLLVHWQFVKMQRLHEEGNG